MTAWLFWLFVGSIVYAYAGYPILLTLLARMRAKPEWESSETPGVTLLIAAYNEEEVIEKKLANSLALDYPADRLQILVATDGSDDRTPDIVRSFVDRHVELSHSPERKGKMAAINRAVPLSGGEIIVFSDANNLYASDALRRLVAPFVEPSIGAVSGAKVIDKGGGTLGESEGMYWRYESFIKEQETRLSTCIGVAGEILAIRRALFEAPPDSIINDDAYMAMRIIRGGHRVVYAPRARSFESVSHSAEDEVARRARIVAGRFQAISMAHRLLPGRPLIAWQIISHKFLRPLVPLAMIGALLANIAAVVQPAEAQGHLLFHLAPPVNWILLTLQIVFYALACLSRIGVKARGIPGRILYLPLFLINSNMAALIGLFRFLTKRQSTRWTRVRRG